MAKKYTGQWVQCGREFSAQEINQVCEMISLLRGFSRKELANTVCENLHWRSASGTLKEQACLGLLEKLEAAERIVLPAKRHQKKHTFARITLSNRTCAEAVVTARLRDIDPVQLEVVTQCQEVGLWNEYVERFHPLGYKGVFGHRLRYFIHSGSQKLGCVLLAGAAKAIAVRDRWLGWEARIRKQNIAWIINNSRFLIFPHVKIQHLASHVLGQLARRVVTDWQLHWGFSPLLLETFVDPAHYAGTCYRAAGWEMLGETSGRGLARPGKNYQSSARLIFVKPLHRDFKAQLTTSALQGRISDE